MTRTILTFGTISGFLCALLMVATVPFADRIGFDRSMIVGYTTMVASFMLVYFGIRSYRDNIGTGQITFARAFVIGIGITTITCIFYVATWEILYFNFLPGFIEKYSAHVVEKARAAGESPAALQAKLENMKRTSELYNNLFFNAAITFIEPFPVGLLMTLISAGVLRRRTPSHHSQERFAATQ